MDTWLRFIGDVHGERRVYKNLIVGAPFSLQLGDLDFDYNFLTEVDFECHRFVPGNHDNYDELPKVKHSLGDFGVWSVPEFGDVFFVRGAWSIDWRARTTQPRYLNGKILQKKDLWLEEEMPIDQCNKALELYMQVKPKFLVSHTCPLNIIKHVTDPMMTHSWGYNQSVIQTRTSILLQSMVEFHQPRVHVFGHFHRSMDNYFDLNGQLMPQDADPKDYTRYICVDVLRYVDFPKNFVNNLE